MSQKHFSFILLFFIIIHEDRGKIFLNKVSRIGFFFLMPKYQLKNKNMVFR